MPCIIINASAHATIFSVLPDKCIVAHNGTTNPATPSSTPLAIVWRSVTGMVAADDDVPSAVKYIETLEKMVNGKDGKTVYIPYEASGILSSIGSIKDMFQK